MSRRCIHSRALLIKPIRLTRRRRCIGTAQANRHAATLALRRHVDLNELVCFPWLHHAGPRQIDRNPNRARYHFDHFNALVEVTRAF
jgi:hypothetical protein